MLRRRSRAILIVSATSSTQVTNALLDKVILELDISSLYVRNLYLLLSFLRRSIGHHILLVYTGNLQYARTCSFLPMVLIQSVNTGSYACFERLCPHFHSIVLATVRVTSENLDPILHCSLKELLHVVMYNCNLYMPLLSLLHSIGN